jgi:capsule polysaccharide export protein KpsE/RkpR
MSDAPVSRGWNQPPAIVGGVDSPGGESANQLEPTVPANDTGVKRVAGWLASQLSFWTVVPIVGLIGFAYLFLFADSFYDSQAIVSMQNSSSSSSSLSTLMSSSLLGSAAGSTQSGAVIAYIESPEMLKILDKQFNLRKIYSSPDHSPFWRLADDASDEDFLSFYQQMVTVNQDMTTQLITIDVFDYDARRGQAICNAVLVAAQNFMNSMSAGIADATIKYAKSQLASATNAVETAQPYERAVAESELSAAQTAMASAQGLASQQQSFLVRVSQPTVPSDTSEPDRLIDEAGILLAAAALYLILHVLLANVRDHRSV